MKYVILDENGDYWSNEDGWVENRGDATEFEDQSFNLPLGGAWALVY